MKNKKIIILTILFLMIFSPSVYAKYQDSQKEIDNLEEEIDKKLDDLNTNEQKLKDIQNDIDKVNQEQDELAKTKEELLNSINSSEKYLKSYLVFLQRFQNESFLLRLMASENFFKTLYQIQKFSFAISNRFGDLLTDLDTLKEKEAEYQENEQQLKEDQSTLESVGEELEENYETLNKELVRLESIADFEVLYDDNAYIDQDEQEKMMEEASIDRESYQYVDYIITKESSWNYTATNPYSGAYGLCQALPPEKMSSMGSDWKENPVTQLKWCDSYANSRYGSWEAATDFWKSNNWW